MNPKMILSGVIGFLAGAITSYLVMEYIHDKEINQIYSELESTPYNGIDYAVTNNIMYDAAVTTFDKQKAIAIAELDKSNKKTQRIIYEQKYIVAGANDKLYEVEAGEYDYTEEKEEEKDPLETDEVEEDGEMKVNDTYGGIYVIPPTEVSARQVVCKYNHDDGSAEVVKMMSIKSEAFDDRIENDALYSLLNEEAYDILMNSEPPTGKDRRMVCVRNNVINLDFVVSY